MAEQLMTAALGGELLTLALDVADGPAEPAGLVLAIDPGEGVEDTGAITTTATSHVVGPYPVPARPFSVTSWFRVASHPGAAATLWSSFNENWSGGNNQDGYSTWMGPDGHVHANVTGMGTTGGEIALDSGSAAATGADHFLMMTCPSGGGASLRLDGGVAVSDAGAVTLQAAPTNFAIGAFVTASGATNRAEVTHGAIAVWGAELDGTDYDWLYGGGAAPRPYDDLDANPTLKAKLVDWWVITPHGAVNLHRVATMPALTDSGGTAAAGAPQVGPTQPSMPIEGWRRVRSIADQSDAGGEFAQIAGDTAPPAWVGHDPCEFLFDRTGGNRRMVLGRACLANRTQWAWSARLRLYTKGGNACVFHSEEGTGGYLEIGKDANDKIFIRAATSLGGAGLVTATTADTLHGSAAITAASYTLVAGEAKSGITTPTDRVVCEFTVSKHAHADHPGTRFAAGDYVWFPGGSGDPSAAPFDKVTPVVDVLDDTVWVVVNSSTASLTAPPTIARVGAHLKQWTVGEQQEPADHTPYLIYDNETITVTRDDDTFRVYAGGFKVAELTATMALGPTASVQTGLFCSPSNRSGADVPVDCYVGGVRAHGSAPTDDERKAVEIPLSVSINRKHAFEHGVFKIDYLEAAWLNRRLHPHHRIITAFRDVDTGELANLGPPRPEAEMGYANPYGTPTGHFVSQRLPVGTYDVEATILTAPFDEDGDPVADACLWDGVIGRVAVEPWPSYGPTLHFDPTSGSASNPGSIGSPKADPLDVPASRIGPFTRLRLLRGETFAGARAQTVLPARGPILMDAYGDPGDPIPTLESTATGALLKIEDDGTVASVRLHPTVGQGSIVLTRGHRAKFLSGAIYADYGADSYGAYMGVNMDGDGMVVDDCDLETAPGKYAYYLTLGSACGRVAFTRNRVDWQIPQEGSGHPGAGAHPLRCSGMDLMHCAYNLQVSDTLPVASWTPRDILRGLNWEYNKLHAGDAVAFYGPEYSMDWPPAARAIRWHRGDAQGGAGCGAQGLSVDHSIARGGPVTLYNQFGFSRQRGRHAWAWANRAISAAPTDIGPSSFQSWEIAPTSGARQNLANTSGDFGEATFSAPDVVVLKSTGGRLVVALADAPLGGGVRYSLAYEYSTNGGSSWQSFEGEPRGPYFAVDAAPGSYLIHSVLTDESGSNTAYGANAAATVTA